MVCFNLTMIIYKYLNQKGTLNTINNNSVLLRLPEEYNDPYDSVFYISEKEKRKAFKLFMNYHVFFKLYSDLVVQNTKAIRFKFYADVLKTNTKQIALRIAKSKRYKYQPDIALYYSTAKKMLKQNDDELREEFENKIDEIMKDIRRVPLISCFSHKYDSTLMWSHYAKDHTGACIEFEISDSNFKNVRYSSHMHTFKQSRILEYVLAAEFLGKEPNYDDEAYLFVVKPIFEKAKCWKYEKEIRCAFSNHDRDNRIYVDEENNVLLKMPPIKRIILGCEADETFIKNVFDGAKSIPIYKMEMVDGKYLLEERKYENK